MREKGYEMKMNLKNTIQGRQRYEEQWETLIGASGLCFRVQIQGAEKHRMEMSL